MRSNSISPEFSTVVCSRRLRRKDYTRARRLVGTHFDLYHIVSADFYGLDGTIGFSYDPSLMGAAAPEAIDAILGENFPGSVSSTMTSLESSDDGSGPPIESALRLIIPVRDQATGDSEGLAIIHRDMSPQIEAVRRMQLIVGLIILTGAIMLHVSMRRIYERSTDRVLQQAAQLQDANDEIGRTLVQGERNERRFRALVQNASDITAVIDGDGKLTYVSPSSGRVLDRPADGLIGSRWIDLVHDEDRLLLEGAIRKLRTTAISEAELEFRLHRSNGEWRHFEALATDLLDEPAVNGIVINSRDVSDRRRVQEELNRRALNDSLTGLPNRVLFADRLKRAL